MSAPNHILAQEGILTSFTIAKKVTVKEVSRLREQFTKDNLTVDQVNRLLQNAIVKETKKAIESNTIPGLIASEISTSPDEKKRIMEFTYFASVISKKIVEKNINKYHSCFIINAIVNMIGLNEKDFENFHRKFSKYKNEDPDDSDTEDDES